jgi:GT2 family glycosyltransferase
MPGENVKLSIIIVNYKAWGHVESALDVIHTGFPGDWEIIIVDNESEPVAFQEFQSRYAWVNLIAIPDNIGFGFGCRVGAAEARGDQLLFMNPDVVATVDEIRALLLEKSEHPDVAVLSPKQVGTDGQPQKVFDDFPSLHNQSKTMKALVRLIVPSRSPDPHAEHTELTYCDWVTGSFLLIDKADYDAIGGWSPDFWMYAEDADLCRRAQNAGLRVAYTPKVQVIHAHGGSSRINVQVKSMTKLEVIISKHVYTWKHTRGLERWLTHCLIASLRLPSLVIAGLLDLISLRQIPTLRVRSRMLRGLLGYYGGVLKSGTWVSPRAQANQA